MKVITWKSIDWNYLSNFGLKSAEFVKNAFRIFFSSFFLNAFNVDQFSVHLI